MLRELLRKRRNNSAAVPRQYRLIVWDFDGTLANSLPHSIEIFNRLAALHGFKPVVDREHDRRIPVKQFLKEHGIKLRHLPKLTKEFWERQSQVMEEVALNTGIEETLRALKERGIAHGILSSNHPANIERCLLRHGVFSLFSFVEGYSKLLGKAKGLKRMMKKKEIRKEEILYVGDETRDILAARKAGIDSAAVAWGLNASDFLLTAQPTYQVQTTQDILNLPGLK